MSRMRLRSRFLVIRLAIAAALTALVILALRYEFLRESKSRAQEELQDCARRLSALQPEGTSLLQPSLETQTLWAARVRLLCSCDVAVTRDRRLQFSTLSADRQSELSGKLPEVDFGRIATITLGADTYLVGPDAARSVPGAPALLFLKSLRGAEQQLSRFTRLVALLAAAAMAIGFFLVVRLSDTFAKPLGNLVKAVRALEKGDFTYPVVVHSGDELAEVTQAFDQMRSSLRESQHHLLQNERLATIGQMASSISHDMRYPLTTVVANAEFLSEETLTAGQRQDLYGEVRSAVEQINGLIESLLEFSRGRETPRRVTVALGDVIDRAIHSVRSRPEFHAVEVQSACPPALECQADPMKLERALRNLLVNACEAAEESGKVGVSAETADGNVEIRVIDNGSGVADEIRATLFQPFVSHGKAAGTGLGLAVVQKICRDHGGDAVLESSAPGRTVFRMTIPQSAPLNAT